MADEKTPAKILDEQYYEELEDRFRAVVARWPNTSEEECWELAKLSVEERRAIEIARAKAIAEGKEPFRAQLLDSLQRLKDKDALKIN